MQWEKYDEVTWKTSGFDQDQPKKNQLRYDSLQPTHQELAKEEYELDATEFNPSAELARAFELIMYNVAAGGDARPPYDYLLTCSSFKWKETNREPVLSGVKQLHNFAHGQIQRFTQVWSSHWGKPNSDKYDFKEKDYLQLAARFYNLYCLGHEDNLVFMDYDEINENIRLHCDVGLHRAARLDSANIGEMTLGDKSVSQQPQYGIGIIPKSLLGFLWLNLADDIANKKSYGVCQGTPDCTRVWGTNVQTNKKTCSSSCSIHLERNTNVEIFPSIFEEILN